MQTRRPSVEGALAALNEHQKSDYVVVRRFDAEVNHGAVLLEGSSGRKVLKVLPSTESLEPQFNAALVTSAVRPSGYPAPRYEAIEEYGDGTYVLMTALPGDKCDFLRDGVEQARQIVSLNDLQQDVAVLPTTWPQVMIDHVFYGGGGCYPEVMARRTASCDVQGRCSVG